MFHVIKRDNTHYFCFGAISLYFTCLVTFKHFKHQYIITLHNFPCSLLARNTWAEMLDIRICAPREDSDQPPRSRRLIRIFIALILNSQEGKVSSRRYRRLWSDCAEVQADFRLRWTHTSKGTFSDVGAQLFHMIDIVLQAAVSSCTLALVLLSPDIPCLCKQCRSRSVGFWRSQLIWIFTVCH